MKPTRLPALLLVLLASLVLAACGSETEQQSGAPGAAAEAPGEPTEGRAEGHYVDIDELKYQVQISRQMNPLLTLDRDYFLGLPDGQMELGDDQEWFGVFLQVQNPGDEAHRLAADFEIHDTQGNTYRPVPMGDVNPFAYRPGPVGPGDFYPHVNSTAGERPPQGALLLFKLRRFSLDNRPLELYVRGPRTGMLERLILDV
jgi:hypothetical protein